ncbi:hypothetical protein VaNZ11_008610 [Volvox africanus]|uniref:TATA element modulatory factor 1 TATA binding domain-containing protein n=1 Tax=Volvox africanus TaxID=51714 RepID=A0ABQ5S6U5_9CHLO|nr:hypothetical protein VaNZ11_008610 [Volvox africanus]
MADISAWAVHAARLSDAMKKEQADQFLRGAMAGSYGHQQRAVSSGRHPRLSGGSPLHGQLQAASEMLYGVSEGSHQATNQSPRPRSVSVGRRHQDMYELVNVMNEISSTGQEIRNMTRRSQEQQSPLVPGRRASGAPGGSSNDGRIALGPGATGSSTAAAMAAAAAAAATNGRSYTSAGSVVAGGGSISSGLRGATGGGGSSVSGKGFARSILGGVESLTTKLMILDNKLTPRKVSPRSEHQRDTSVGRRNPSSSGEGPNYRDMLAEVNAGLLQGHGLLDTVQGSRDQRPSASSLGQGGRMAFDPPSMRPSVTGGSSVAGGGATGSNYGSTVAPDWAASLIMANTQQRAEELQATDRMLESIHAQIRGGVSAGAAGGPTTGAAAAAADAPGQTAVTSATLSSALLEAGAGAAAGGGSGADGANRNGSAPRRRAAAGSIAGGGMLQPFLATLSEAMPLPQTPVIRGPLAGAETQQGGPAQPVQSRHLGPHVPAPPPPIPRGLPSGSATSSPVSGIAGPRSARNQQRYDMEYRQQQQQQQQKQIQQQMQQQQQQKQVQQMQQQRLQQQMQLLQQRHERQPQSGFVAPADAAAPLQLAPPPAERSTTTGEGSMSTADIDATFNQRLMDLQTIADNLARSGIVTPEVESSAGSAGAASGEAASLLTAGRRRDGTMVAAAAAGSGPLRREGAASGAAAFLLGPRGAWLEDAAAATLPATTAGAGAWALPGSGVGGLGASRDGDGKSGRRSGASHLGGPSASAGVGLSGASGGAAAISSGYTLAAPHQTTGSSQGSQWPEDGGSLDSLHMNLLMQQRKKERARREELCMAESDAATSRARKEAADLQAQHDKLVTQYHAERQRTEVLKAELERVTKDCARRKEQLQQLSDLTANSVAQTRELQKQLQDARAREEEMRRQVEHANTAMFDQAARQKATVERALQEFLSLLESVASSNSSISISNSTTTTCSGRSTGQILGKSSGSHNGDMESMLESLRARLREQCDVARRQKEMLDAAEAKLAEERSSSASARETASAERAGEVALVLQQANFQRARAEELQKELGHQRELATKLDLRVRQLEDERERAVRQRDAAEMSLQAQQSQLEAAQQQQDVLVGRLYDGQRAKEDAEVLQTQIRSLGRQLEEARAAAARSEANERKATSECEAREELDSKLAVLQSQLGEREAALEASRRRIRELETAANSAVASRQVATEEVTKRSEELRKLTAENGRMIQHLDRLQQERRGLEAKVQKLEAQVQTLQQDMITAQGQLSAAKDQLAAAKESSVVLDATLAQHQLSADLAAARSEAAALRAAHEAASEYAQTMARTLRQHGLSPPPPPSSTDVVSQIGDLQAKLSAESSALAAAKTEVSELRQQLADARSEIERLKRESQYMADRYSQLESAHANSQQSWQHAASVDAEELQKLTKERDALQRQVHSLQLAGNHEADELRRKLARVEVQVESLSGSKREAEERVRVLTLELGALRKTLGDKEAQMEAMRLALEDAKAAASQAAEMQLHAETQVAQVERARLAAVAEADKARTAAEAERARAAAAAEVEAMRAKEEAERAKRSAAKAATAERAREEAEQGRVAAAAELEKQEEEIGRLQSEVERLEKELEDRNAEYAGLYDYCGQVIGERDAMMEEREAFSASAAAAAAEVAALRQEIEELREDLADKEQRLAVKPKMAELQARINELSVELADLKGERDAAVAENHQLSSKLQEETEAHFQTDGRRVRLGEEVERLRGILKMYSIPF